MSELIDLPCGEDGFVLDDATADAIISGTVTQDIPDDFRSLADLFDSVRRPREMGAGAREERAVIEMFRTVRDDATRPRRSPMTRKLTVKTAALAGVLTLASAGAAAASGLPGAAQDTAAAALERIGISVPGANDHSGDHPNTRGSSGDTSTTDVTPDEANATPTLPEKADEIVAIATDSSVTGVDKGQAVSSLASDGESRAGADHPSSSASTARPASVPAGPPASVPAGPPADVPAGPPASVPVGPPVSVPAGPPASVPAGPPADHPVGPPASGPAGPPVSVPVEPPSDHPVGPPASHPVTPPQHP